MIAARSRTCCASCSTGLGLAYAFDAAVRRGLAYYTEDGFEVRCDQLGAQKQVAGGGRYAEGIGWAIGLERLILALTASPAAPCT